MEWKSHFFSKNRELILVILLSLIIRAFLILNSRHSFYSDDAIYGELARFWTQGKWNLVFHPTWPPLFPAVGALVFVLVRNWELALRFVSLLSFLVLLIPLFYLVQKTLSKTHAVIFTLALGLLTPVLKISIYPQSDMLATSLVVSFIVCFFFALQKNNTRLFFLSAFLVGSTFLVRSEGTLFFSLSLGFLIPYFLFQLLRKKVTLRKVAVVLAGFVTIFIVTASPYIIATGNQLGRFTLSQKFSAQIKQEHAFQLRSSGTTWSQEVVSVKYPNYKSAFFTGGVDFLLENIDWFIFWFGQKYKIWINVFFSVFPLFSLLIMIIGLVVCMKKYVWGTLYLSYLIVTGVLTTVFSTPLADIRYLLWVVPLLLYLFLAGLKKFPLLAIVLIFLFPSFNISPVLNPVGYSIDYTNQHYREEIIKASGWIKVNSTQVEPRIMTRYESFEFYTDGMTVYLPQDLTYEQMLDYARENRVDYLIASTETLSSDKNLNFLLKEDATYPGLKKVFVTRVPSRVVIVFGILNAR